MIKIQIADGSKGRKKLLAGASRVGELVGISLGPKGRNAIIKTRYSAPQIVNDGVTIARNIMLPDDIEDLGAQTLIEGSMKADERAGDGTTTTTVLASKIVAEYAKKIEEEDKSNSESGTVGEAGSGTADVNKMAKEILDTGKVVVEKLVKMAKPLKKDQLKNVISSSLGVLFPEFVESLTETIESVGKDGYVSVEDNWHTQYGIDTELIKGMRFLGTYVTPYMINTKRKEAVMEDVYVLVCNHDLASMSSFYRDAFDPKSGSVIKDLLGKGIRKIVILANKFERPLIELMAATVTQARQGNTNLMDFLCVKAPSLTTEQWQDVAVYCDGMFFDKNRTDIELRKAGIEHLGFVKKIVVNEDEIIMINGRGNTKNRVELLQEELKGEKDPAFAEQIKRRIGALQSGFAVIRVGASTEGERMIAKKKIEDAVKSAQSSMAEGVLPGGGQALKTIADELGEKHPMYVPLCEPFNKIQRSFGGSYKIPNTVLDPLKVTRIAVETSCSVAASLITAEVAIAEKNPSLVDELQETLYPKNENGEDFRTIEEQKFRT